MSREPTPLADTIRSLREQAAAKEREAIVAWLRSEVEIEHAIGSPWVAGVCEKLALKIERGEYIT